ncbi:MAG: LysM peptidoglycan-binding domain-containing protein [Oceanospirillales bacterium]|nr:MAG: LysM peptidoglycan-binding domain-containing protein [Oceanospirillales bacterium]
MRFKSLAICTLALINVLTVVYANNHANSHTHQVQKGDSLSSLAQQYLGSASRWREIWAANPTIRNPDQIIAGTQILIPTTRISSTGQGLTSSLQNYQQAATEFVNSGHVDRFIHHRALIRQSDLNKQLHVSAIDQSTNRMEIIASSIQPQQTNNYLIIRENQSHPSVSGDIIEARIIGHATANHTGGLKTLTVNDLFQPLHRDEIAVIPDQRLHFSSNNVQIHSPNMPSTANVIQVLHNEPSGLFTVIETSANQIIQPGGMVRYRNPGTSAHSYDGVLLVVSSIQGASYAAVLSAKAPPMPTATVF